MKKHIRKAFVKNAMISLLIALLFLLLLTRSRTVIDYMKKGLELCSRSVIPSLFPLMVVSELATGSFGSSFWRKLLSPIANTLFGVGADSAIAFFLGALCGFPVGARVLCDAFDGGRITKKELERSLCFCNNTGLGFAVSAVGTALFGNPMLGIVLFACVLTSSLLVALSLRLIFGSVTDKNTTSAVTLMPSRPFIERFTKAVRSSALSMLTVCAFVVFFSSLVGCLGAIMLQLDLPKEALAVLFCLFELSSGVGAAAELSPTLAVILTAAALSWSGLSVHFQIMTVCADRSISFAPYFVSKAVQSAVSASLAAIILRFFPLSEQVFSKTEAFAAPSPIANGIFVCCVFAIASILPIFFVKIRRNPCKKSNRKFF